MNWWQIVLAGLMLVLLGLYLVAIPMAKRRALRKQNEMIDRMQSGLKIGDTVVLIDGISGRLVELGDDMVKVAIAPQVVIQVKRMGIAGIVTQGGHDETAAVAAVHSPAQ